MGFLLCCHAFEGVDHEAQFYCRRRITPNREASNYFGECLNSMYSNTQRSLTHSYWKLL